MSESLKQMLSPLVPCAESFQSSASVSSSVVAHHQKVHGEIMWMASWMVVVLAQALGGNQHFSLNGKRHDLSHWLSAVRPSLVL